MLLVLLIYVVLRALWKIDVHLISTLVNKSLLSLLYIGTTLANLNGLGNYFSSSYAYICVSAGAIIGPSIFKNLNLCLLYGVRKGIWRFTFNFLCY